MVTEKRLIDADALMAQLEDRKAFLVKEWGYRDHYARGFDEAVDTVDNAPTVDAVEVVHGRWEDEYGGAFANPRYRCSVCKEKATYRHEQDCLVGWHEVQALTDYCSHCGAKMDGDGNG